ncbi:BCCT family transporter [Pseudovibrio sp. SPO723]|uniref:BCCT family transporter n=1 Tax=Nesiotobacter zosterae TaxID=392721 RepID=UPI0029C50434|nr:BCCT family transporter [Pseudovibrio sp. SPO723]MDX5594338.1 BCCT family transporter [Pseudovibrio sp. SPO723]
MSNRSIRPLVFWPPFLLLFAAVAASYITPDQFLSFTTSINSWILDRFSWLFSLGTLLMVVTCVWVYVSPLGAVKIGGKDATPILSRWRWFSIALCTTVAIGILFWGTAEPMYHLHGPPASLGLEAGSPEAATFAMSTMFLHWSFTPYAIYTIPSLMFALAYYNLKLPYSLGSALAPILGRKLQGPMGQVLDAVALYALVAGMAASLGTGILTLAGGLDNLIGTGTTPVVLGALTTLIVVSFIISAASGLKRGIAILSSLNTRFFFVFCAFVFIFGPTNWILSMGVEGFGDYIGTFFQKSTFTGIAASDPWPQWWTIFYWANWLAWAPIAALFLGKISRGYTVRQFILTNLVFPSLFACVWMSIFSGSALFFDMHGNGLLHNALTNTGAESVVYTMLEQLPLPGITAVIFVFVSFLSYVTAADSNTEAMANLCAETPSESPERADSAGSSTLVLKVVWGATIGIIAWFMTSYAGVDGIKMMSNLGGLPALFIVLGCNASLIYVMTSKKFELHPDAQPAPGARLSEDLLDELIGEGGKKPAST